MSITIIESNGLPDAEAQCPTCGTLVKCHSDIVQLAFSPRYITFHHDKCRTAWKRYIDEERTEICSGTTGGSR